MDGNASSRVTATNTDGRAASFRGSPVHATIMLFVVTFLWGFSFPLVKNWLNAAKDTDCPGGEVNAILTLIAVRTTLALAVLAVFQPGLFLRPSWREHAIGALIGFFNFVGFGLQVWGLNFTSPALSAFFTSLGSAWVPLLVFAMFGVSVSPLTLVGLGLAIGGAGVLAKIDTESGWALGWGEQLNLFASIIFAMLIVLLDRYGRAVRPGHLTVGFLTATGLPALALAGGWAAAGPGLRVSLDWTWSMLWTPWVFADIAVLTVACTVLAFHWFTVYQPRVSASRAALIYLFEPVFASILSIVWRHDSVSMRLALGGGLILLGNLLVELPGWLKFRQAPEEDTPAQMVAIAAGQSAATDP
jgi:drug/metabolite transporter (DMT)-like permease